MKIYLIALLSVLISCSSSVNIHRADFDSKDNLHKIESKFDEIQKGKFYLLKPCEYKTGKCVLDIAIGPPVGHMYYDLPTLNLSDSINKLGTNVVPMDTVHLEILEIYFRVTEDDTESYRSCFLKVKSNDLVVEPIIKLMNSSVMVGNRNEDPVIVDVEKINIDVVVLALKKAIITLTDRDL